VVVTGAMGAPGTPADGSLADMLQSAAHQAPSEPLDKHTKANMRVVMKELEEKQKVLVLYHKLSRIDVCFF